MSEVNRSLELAYGLMVLSASGVSVAVGLSVWKLAMAGPVAGALATFGAFTISVSAFRSTVVARARRRATARIDEIGAWELIDAEPNAWPLLAGADLERSLDPGEAPPPSESEPASREEAIRTEP